MTEPGRPVEAGPGSDGGREGACVEVAIESVTSEGAGVGRLPDGRAVFVHRTAPGDRVRAKITRSSSRWARAGLEEVLEPGPDRREAPCPHYERCGGCTLEHLAYDAQLRAKGRIVTDALERIGKLVDPPFPQLHPSPREVRYRNRVTFTLLRLPKGRIVAGFHELERPGRIMDVDGRCLLPEGALAAVWDGLRGAWGPGAARLPRGRRLRLTLRANEAGEVLLLVEGGRGRGEPEALLGAVPELHSIWRAGESAGAPATHLAGPPRFGDSWMGEEVEVRPGAFLQVNREAAELLHHLVLEEVGPAPGARVLDAYSGIGTYARGLADTGAEVTAIEADPGAVAASRERGGGDATGPGGFRVVEGRVEDRLDEALPADLAILNPPRSGVADGVMERLGRARPDRIVYVSCDPATLARDVARLGPGYRPERLHAVDLFPQTARVEAVLILTAE